MFPGCWRVGWLLVLPRVARWKQYHSHLEVVGGGGGGGDGRVRAGGGWGVEEGEEKVCSGESRCRPPSQRNFDGGSDAPVGETLSHFLRVSSQSDGGSVGPCPTPEVM